MSEPTEVTAEVEKVEPRKLPPLDKWRVWVFDESWYQETAASEDDAQSIAQGYARKGLHVRIVHVHDTPKADELAEWLTEFRVWMKDLHASGLVPAGGVEAFATIDHEICEALEKR